MSDAPVIDATAEEVPADAAAHEQVVVENLPHTSSAPGVALAPRPVASNEVLMPLDATKVVDGMKAYQRLLHDLLDPTDWQQTNELEPDPQNPGRKRKKRFPKKSAYRKIARAFNLSFEVVSRSIDRDAEGHPLSAETVIRAVAPNGQYGDGDGYCSISEFTGRRGNDPKLENSMRATATTRAKNRAIADLVGMGEVSAEEIVAAGAPAEPAAELPAWAREASRDRKAQFIDVAGKLGLAPGDAKALGQAMRDHYGCVPDVAVGVLVGVVRKLEQTAASVHAQTGAAPAGGAPPGAPAPTEPASPDPSSSGGAGSPSADTAAAGAQGALDGVPSGSVPMPVMSGTPAQDITRLREAGCICSSPLQANESEDHRDHRCPVSGHGLPY